jgi:hypothetical protein
LTFSITTFLGKEHSDNGIEIENGADCDPPAQYGKPVYLHNDQEQAEAPGAHGTQEV